MIRNLKIWTLISLVLSVSVAEGGSAGSRVVWFRLAPVPEGMSEAYMSASTGEEFSVGRGDEEEEGSLEEFLATDREALQAELDQMRALVSNFSPDTPGDLVVSKNSGSGGRSGGIEGAVRELKLEGYPPEVLEQIMNRYNLRVVLREFKAGSRGQNFLSSASKGPGEQYFGGLSVPPGVYEVFQLNQETVGLMSRLEEDAIREQGLEPLKTRVIRVVFGIVNSAGGGYELGVLSLDAERVSP